MHRPRSCILVRRSAISPSFVSWRCAYSGSARRIGFHCVPALPRCACERIDVNSPLRCVRCHPGCGICQELTRRASSTTAHQGRRAESERSNRRQTLRRPLYPSMPAERRRRRAGASWVRPSSRAAARLAADASFNRRTSAERLGFNGRRRWQRLGQRSSGCGTSAVKRFYREEKLDVERCDRLLEPMLKSKKIIELEIVVSVTTDQRRCVR